MPNNTAAWPLRSMRGARAPIETWASVLKDKRIFLRRFGHWSKQSKWIRPMSVLGIVLKKIVSEHLFLNDSVSLDGGRLSPIES